MKISQPTVHVVWIAYCIMQNFSPSSGRLAAHHGDGVHGVEYGEEENVILGIRHIRRNGTTHAGADSIWGPVRYKYNDIYICTFVHIYHC